MGAQGELAIRNELGVCSAEEDTRLLAETALQFAGGGPALDLGTGTGYVAIYLARHGIPVDAVDISRRALRLAGENAAANGVRINLYRSDLFSAVQGRYAVIAFNPPMNPGETEWTRVATSFLRRHPGVANLFMRAFDRFLDSSRIGFLVDFLRQAVGHLAPAGSIVIELTRAEIDELAGLLPELEFGRRVDIPRLPTEQIVVVRRRGAAA